MMRTTLLAVLLSLAIVNAILPLSPPVPKYEHAVRFGNTKAKNVFEIYIALSCPDCKALWNDVVLKLINVPSIKDKVAFEVRHFALPYHTSSFELNKALLVVAKNVTEGKAEKVKFDFVKEVLLNQDPIYNEPLLDVTTREIPSIIYDKYISKVNPNLSKDDFLKMMSERSLWEEARATFKYATSRGVFGTPTILINGVPIYNSGYMGLMDWIEYLDKL
ncbi:Sipa1l2 [Acrasis kona]|uniref:Sipa1l2 n=1 Tax=Acrasis kona TaxID=1008807 RepID=A0AAW2Z7J1_9EUKA